MKRKRLLQLAVIGIGLMAWAVIPAGATIQVTWYWDIWTTGNVMRNDGITPLPANSIVQLIYSQAGVLGALDPYNPLTPTGDNQLLDTRATAQSGGNAYWNYGTVTYGGSGDYVGGYVFQRVFDTTYGSAPLDGSYYSDYYGYPAGMVRAGPTEDADSSPFNPTVSALFNAVDLGGGTPTNLVLNQMCLIPEPATLTLMGFGLAALGLRRLRRPAASVSSSGA